MGVINLGILVKKIMSKISGAGYIKDTDYASSSKGGTIKTDSTYATDITSGGKLKAKEITAEAYSEANDAAFISKATLDNVLASHGSGFSKTSIWSGDADFGTSGTYVTLSEDYDKYDALYLVFQNDTTHVSSPMLVFTADVPVAESASGNTFGTGVSTNTVNSVTLGGFWMSTKTKMNGVGGPAVHLKKVYGVNF